MTLLQTSQLNAGYSKLQILWNVNITVPEKSVTALIGSNGAGKTTLIKVLSGLIKPYSGKVFFKNADITGLPPHRIRQMGLSVVPEGRRLFPNLTVRENLLMGAYTIKNRQELEERIAWVEDLFPILRERRKQPARQLSGGEAQMLAIARALVTSSDLLVVDEPSSGLAPKVVELIFDKLVELKQKGFTFLVVDQFVERALSICDHAYVMENGRIAISGKREEVQENEHLKKHYLGL
ncbi:MAG: ABC transporter ATP-binding protein [Candidatus Caldarchaeum sp.]|nr:ABC transporter ATP-binding protein [Candidatus Caldarchaeum sp.]MDW8063984.1 ABC transporter ATP-binding protein [Candidatus Caldarchaeum sp.]